MQPRRFSPSYKSFPFRSRFRSICFSLLISFLFIVPRLTVAQPTAYRLDSLFASLQAEQRLNGNVLISERGTIRYRKSFGFARLNDIRLNRSDTRFQLASIGKTFTAVAVLQLYEQGTIRLDDPLVNYLPDFPFPTITIRQLLAHTSGLADLQIFDPYLHEAPRRILTNADVIPALKRFGKLLFEPGERWSYSNPGYCVLAILVEKLSKMPFHTFLAQHIWKVAKMSDTYPFSIPNARPDDKRAENYQPVFYSSQWQWVDTMKRYQPLLVNFGGLQGLGFIASTVDDLLAFDKALHEGRLLTAQTLLKAYTATRLTNGKLAEVEPGRTSYGLGWFVGQDTTANKLVWHSGFIPGGSTLFLRNLTRQQTVVILNNAECEGVQESGEQALRLLMNQPLAPGKKSVAKHYAKALFERGPNYAAARFLVVKADTAQYSFSPAELDYVGRQFMQHGYTDQALETLKVLTFAEPQAWQPYNSYAEILQQSGQKAEAILMYRKSLSLNADNNRLKQVLDALLQEK